MRWASPHPLTGETSFPPEWRIHVYVGGEEESIPLVTSGRVRWPGFFADEDFARRVTGAEDLSPEENWSKQRVSCSRRVKSIRVQWASHLGNCLSLHVVRGWALCVSVDGKV